MRIRREQSCRERIVSICLMILTVLFLGTIYIGFTERPAYAQKEIELKLVSAWAPPFLGTDKLMEFIERVNRAGAGKVKIKFLGGSEIAPPMEQLEYLKRGAFDLCFNTPTFYAGLVPAALVVYYNDLSPTTLRECGFRGLFDEMHRKKADLTVLGSLWRGDNYSLFTRTAVRKADIAGLKIRSVPQFDDFIKGLGGTPVTVEPAEAYQALQRGLVDGAITPIIQVEKYRYNEVTKFFISPLIPWVTDAPLLAKAQRWDGLPKDVQKIIIDTIIEMEPIVWNYYKEINNKTVKRLQEQFGMTMITLPPEEAKKYISLAYSAPWDYSKKYDAEWVGKLKATVARYLK